MTSDYDAIRSDNITEYGKGIRHMKQYGGSLYADRTHFIFELLQNAEDAGASRILFTLNEGILKIQHNGREFNNEDVLGICGVGESTKESDITKIGEFGQGFKSVFAYTSCPEVHSGDEHFSIKDFTRPYSVDPKLIGESWTTLFYFQLGTENIDSKKATNAIKTGLERLSPRVLIFLKNIETITLQIHGKILNTYSRQIKPRGKGKYVSILTKNNESNEYWIVYDKKILAPETNVELPVEIAFKLEKNEGSKSEKIKRPENTQLVVFFPTDKETRLGFLIQGAYSHSTGPAIRKVLGH